MRPAIFEPQQIIEAGLALQAEGRNITGFALRNRVGGGNPGGLSRCGMNISRRRRKSPPGRWPSCLLKWPKRLRPYRQHWPNVSAS